MQSLRKSKKEGVRTGNQSRNKRRCEHSPDKKRAKSINQGRPPLLNVGKITKAPRVILKMRKMRVRLFFRGVKLLSSCVYFALILFVRFRDQENES